MDAAENQTKRIEELSEDLTRSRCEHEDVAEENARQTKAVRDISESKELEILRAVNEERRRFDDREERLLRQIAELERSPLDAHGHLDHHKEGTPDPVTVKETPQTHEERLGESGKVITSGESMTGPSREPHPLRGDSYSTCASSQIVFANQLPPLASFKGDTSPDVESIDEWLERFEMLAEECRWTPCTKLLHLTSRVEKQAYAFYHSCTPQVWTSFKSLAAELRKRFKPVRIQGVDTSRFHDRKQKLSKTVNAYTQELRQLHQRAYPESIRGSTDAEKIGKTLLASQFVAGLRPEIKKSVTGSEQSTDMEHLLAGERLSIVRQCVGFS